MNIQQFWQELQQSIYQSGEISETTQAQWEKLVQIHDSPSLPTQLIIETVCHGSVYLESALSHLNFPAITPHLSLSGKQQIALEMTLSNSPIAFISGSAATGKTRIANTLIHAAINHHKRILILTHYQASLVNYLHLGTYPFLLSQPQDYQEWIINQLRSEYLAQPQMDYLPLHLLPDTELAKLRTPAKLETWLSIIENNSHPKIVELLKLEFPDLAEPRIELLAYRLQQLEPLLKQQLNLSQLYNNLSETGLREIANQLIENPQVPIVGTMSELMQYKNRFLWENNFDLIIVEESQHLSWVELMLLSGLSHKLVLFGEIIPKYRRQLNQKESLFAPSSNCFQWLKQNLFPTYVYELTEQFRLHQKIAELVYPCICDDWIQTQSWNTHYYFPETKKRLIWNDISNPKTKENIIQFIQTLDKEIIPQIGIITFSIQDRDDLQKNLSRDYGKIFIGTIAEWVGNEREIIIVNFSNLFEKLTLADVSVVLTRAKDYLFLFGDYDLWRKNNSPFKQFLNQPKLYKERLVILS